MRDLPDAAINAARQHVTCEGCERQDEYCECKEIARSALLAALPHLEAAIRADEYNRGYIAGAADALDDEGRTHFVSPTDEARIRAYEREKCAREVEGIGYFGAGRRAELFFLTRDEIASRLRAGEQTTTTCPYCGGIGRRQSGGRTHPCGPRCPACDGTGRAPSSPTTRGLDLDPDPDEGRRLADDLPGSY